MNPGGRGVHIICAYTDYWLNSFEIMGAGAEDFAGCLKKTVALSSDRYDLPAI